MPHRLQISQYFGEACNYFAQGKCPACATHHARRMAGNPTASIRESMMVYRAYVDFASKMQQTNDLLVEVTIPAEEITVNPASGDILGLAHSAKISLNVATNGFLLHRPAIIEKFVTAPVKTVRISLNAGVPLHTGTPVREILRNVRHLWLHKGCENVQVAICFSGTNARDIRPLVDVVLEALEGTKFLIIFQEFLDPGGRRFYVKPSFMQSMGFLQELLLIDAFTKPLDPFVFPRALFELQPSRYRRATGLKAGEVSYAPYTISTLCNADGKEINLALSAIHPTTLSHVIIRSDLRIARAIDLVAPPQETRFGIATPESIVSHLSWVVNRLIRRISSA